MNNCQSGTHHTGGLVKTNNEQAQVNKGIGCPSMAH